MAKDSWFLPFNQGWNDGAGPPKVAADPAYQNAMKNTPSTARIEHDKALKRVITAMFKDDARCGSRSWHGATGKFDWPAFRLTRSLSTMHRWTPKP